jgi:C-terminal processing protease CtpA/Prc
MVASEMRDDGLAYISLTQFGDFDCGRIATGIGCAAAAESQGMILDLRNNGGDM